MRRNGNVNARSGMPDVDDHFAGSATGFTEVLCMVGIVQSELGSDQRADFAQIDHPCQIFQDCRVGADKDIACAFALGFCAIL